MLDGILAGIEQEGEPLVLSNLDEEKTETSQESPAEQNQTEESPSSDGEQAEPDNNPKEKNLPFDQHPRWIERENEWKTRFQSIEEKLQSYERAQEEAPKSHEVEVVPKPFVELYGDNPEVWDKYQELARLEREAIKNELVQDQIKAQQAKAAEAERWNSWVDKSIADISSKHGKTIVKDSSEWNELLKVTLDYLPTDQTGSISFDKGYDLMMKLRKEDSSEKSKARKSLAASTEPEVKAEAAPKDYYTPSQLKRGWRI